MAQFLAVLGLETDVRSDAVDFLFQNRLHGIELEDIEVRLERRQVSAQQAAMQAAGLPVG